MSNHRFDEEAFSRILEEAQAPHSLDAKRMASIAAAIERARPEPARPSLDFASVLRSRIVAEAEKAARLPWRERAAVWARAKNESFLRSFRVVAATGLAAMLLLGTSAAFAGSTNALPGEWSYSLKRAKESLHLSVTRAPLARGYYQLERARTRLDEVARLTIAGADDARLYVSTLGDMDSVTLSGSELLVSASRAGAGAEPLQRLATFTSAQRIRLDRLVVSVPAGARPAARDSLATLVLLGDRVQSILEGCDCSGNPLEIPTAAAGQTGPGCSCEGTGGSSKDSDGTDPQAAPEPSNTPGTPRPSPSPSSGTDLVPGSTVDDPVNGVVDGVNDVLDGLGLPTVLPSPLPTPGLGL